MSVFGPIFASLDDPNSSLARGFSSKTKSGVTITPGEALTIPGFFAGVRNIAEDIGKLPLITYRRLDRGKERAVDHPYYSLLHDDPNDDFGSMAFREMLTQWAMCYGNGYAAIRRDQRGGIVGLDPIHPTRVIPRRKTDGTILYKVINKDFSSVELRRDEVFHLKGLGYDGLAGYSLCQLAREALGLAKATQQFSASFYGQGMHSPGAIQFPEGVRYTPEDKEELRRSWKELHSGLDNAFANPVILGDGATWQSFGINQEDAQFIEGQYFSIEEFARLLRIPPHKLQHLFRATFSNIDAQNVEYVQDTLQPWLIRWEEEIRRKIFGINERTYFAEFLVLGLLRGDLKAQAFYYSKMFWIGVLSRNDIREAENMNPVEGGDEYLVQGQMMPATAVAAGATMVRPGRGPAGSSNGPDQNEGNDNRAEEVKEGLLCVFTDTWLRIITRELRALDRARPKTADSPEGIQKWSGQFYISHRLHVLDSLRAPCESLCRLLGLQLRDKILCAIIEEATDNYIEDSRQALTVAADSDSVDSLVEHWQNGRAAEFALDTIARVCND